MAENETLQQQQGAADTAQATENQPAGGSSEKLYTDAYVKARIDKKNEQHAKELAARDERIAELEKQAKEASAKAETLEREKQKRDWAQQVAKETGVDASILRGETLEELQAHAADIKAAMPTAPVLQGSGAPAPKTKMTRDDVAKSSLKDIYREVASNPSLYGIDQRKD